MWKYQNTDELYHSNMYKNIGKKSEHELYHSDVYLGKDYSDGIRHYKYIRKYQKNGKTYYVYDNSQEKLGDLKAKAALNIANKIGERGYIDKEGYTVHNKFDKNGITSKSRRYMILAGPGSEKKRTSKDILLEKAQKKTMDIVYNHSKQKIKDIPKKIIAKGISAIFKTKMKIDDIINNIKKK